MRKNYITEKLPYNFYFVGILFLIFGVYLIIDMNYIGGILFAISLPILLTHWGVIVDTNNKRIKKYMAFAFFKRGKWVDISSVKQVDLGQRDETELMTHKSLAGVYTVRNLTLTLVLEDSEIEILSGKKEFIEKAADKISKGLGVNIVK